MRLFAAILLWLGLALSVSAQQTSPQILIMDSERLFIETLYGQRLADELAERARELQTENDRIVESLTLEERSLTLRRPEMSPEDFRAESEAFDAKVQEFRRVRDAKNVELQVATAGARAQFEQQVQGILAHKHTRNLKGSNSTTTWSTHPLCPQGCVTKAISSISTSTSTTLQLSAPARS